MIESPPATDRFDEYVSYLRALNPPVVRAWNAQSEAEFRDAVEESIEWGIRDIEEGARRFYRLDEPGLSLLLTKFLERGGIPAVSEGYHNGHVDVTVSHPADRFPKILGECKKYRGLDWHCEGCEQLLTRYLSGRSGRGFCLEFFVQRDMYGKLSTLRIEFDRQLPHQQKSQSCDHKIKGAFVTCHAHFTGTVVEILHLGCNVYHPEAREVNS